MVDMYDVRTKSTTSACWRPLFLGGGMRRLFPNHGTLRLPMMMMILMIILVTGSRAYLISISNKQSCVLFDSTNAYRTISETRDMSRIPIHVKMRPPL